MRTRATLSLSLLFSALACQRADETEATRVQRLDPERVAPERVAPERLAPAHEEQGSVPAASAAPVLVEPYAPGRWRQRPLAELSDTMLWLSHVLIRHEGVEGARASFTTTEWRVPVLPATRSREQALALAQQVAADARQGAAFASLAGERSEDPVTRTRGGSLGGVTLVQFLPWPKVLDALESLAPGDVSRPVETELGFHVFLRRAQPPEQRVSGAHLVIGHDDAPWIEVAGRRTPRRSREEALRQITDLQRQADAAPAAFARLAEEHSDHRDALRGGDFGSWSTHEPTPFAREIEILSALEVGQVSEPIDTVVGLQLLQRTPDRPRGEYAIERLLLRFDASLPEGAPGSRSAVRARAEQLAQQAQSDPKAFDAQRSEECCADRIRLIEGREPPELEQLVARLRPGQIAEHPLEFASVFYIIPRRLELASLPPRHATRFELARPDVD